MINTKPTNNWVTLPEAAAGQVLENDMGARVVVLKTSSGYALKPDYVTGRQSIGNLALKVHDPDHPDEVGFCFLYNSHDKWRIVAAITN